ncbi:hypothetical protein BDY21DRAFT_340261, partial [Lineolata rhizophorae]
MRRAALAYEAPARPWLDSPDDGGSARGPMRPWKRGWRWLKRKAVGAAYAVVDLLRRPAYAVPLLINVTGSVWFFLLIGKAELSLTVPITNSLAFLFTVLGEWWAEGKVISRDTWLGMGFVLGGIALCVQSKS